MHFIVESTRRSDRVATLEGQKAVLDQQTAANEGKAEKLFYSLFQNIAL